MIVDNYKFEVYLEGYLIPGVIFFNINEGADKLPSAIINISGNNKSLKLLAGTLVQIFGSRITQENNESILIYEGELTSISYSYNSDHGDTISLNTHSLLSQFYSTKLRPIDAIVNYYEENASGVPNGSTLLLRSPDKKLSGAKSTNSKSTKKEYTTVSYKATSGLKAILTNENLNFAAALGKDTAGAEGNFFPFFKTVNDMFIQSDILYAINAKSINLFDSVFIYPNPGLPYYFQVLAMLETIKKNNAEVSLQLGFDSIVSIAKFFNSFKERLYYRSIAPAALTSSNLFYSDVQDYKITDSSPIREYYIPGIESGPPALTNIIFPEEINNISFTHDLYGELTRLVLKSSFSVVDNNISNIISPTVVSPDISLVEVGEKPDVTVYTQFTDEELYRGVNLKKATIDGVLNHVLVQEMKSPSKSGKYTTSSDISKEKFDKNQNGIASSLQIAANRQYVVSKFNTRTIQISTVWNPNFVVGLPGMVFMDGMPTFVGIVAQADHSCNTNGTVITSVVLTNCRVIFDDEITTTKVEPVLNPLRDSLITEESETAIYGGLSYMFEENLYSFDRMGEFLYNYIITGKINKALFEKVVLVKPDELWTEFTNLSDELASNDTDYSILKYVKYADNTYYSEVLSKVLEYGRVNNLEEVPEEVKNGIILKEAIKAFKKRYKSLKNNNELDDSLNLFRQRVTQRNLVTKENYLSFIGGHNPSSHQQVAESDTKDLIKIVKETLNGDLGFLKNYISKLELPTLSKTKYNKIESELVIINRKLDATADELKRMGVPAELSQNDTPKLKEQLEKEGTFARYTQVRNEQKKLIAQEEQLLQTLEELGDSLLEGSVETAHLLSLFKPYNRTRKAHVVESFKDFTAAFDIIVKGN
jgi:hypothetical protein